MTNLASDDRLLQDIRGLIEEARSAIAVTVNAFLTMLYWQIGRRKSSRVSSGQTTAKQILPHCRNIGIGSVGNSCGGIFDGITTDRVASAETAIGGGTGAVAIAEPGDG